MNSPIGWIGGKRSLRATILDRFPNDGVGRYIEVFFGAGWVFFGREKHPGQLEVINDKDGQLVNLWRCIKYHRAALQEELDWLLSSREIFQDALSQIHAVGLTDIQRAARYFYLIKTSFGCDKCTFATSSKSIQSTLDYLAKVQERLKGVVIENRDFDPILKTYDRADALFYLDPPYLGTEHYYGGSSSTFAKEDHVRRAAALKKIKGRFILSYNDDVYIRKLYEGWCSVESVKRRNLLSGAGKNQKNFAELIIRNY